MDNQRTDLHEGATGEPVEPPLSITRLLRTLGQYKTAIAVTLLAIVVGYAIVALAIYLLAPSQRATMLRFRLTFEGAEMGQYPNGVKFSSADIISTPILNDVYEQNDIRRFARIGPFVQAFAVIETNREYEAKAADVEAQLADPRTTPVDRERILRDWEAQQATLRKNEFVLTFNRTAKVANIPEPVVKKCLMDILRRWTEVVTVEQHVFDYRIATLSPNFLKPTAAEQRNLVAATQVLRTRIANIRDNVAELLRVPGTEQLRSAVGNESNLRELSLRLEDLVRFRLDPLVRMVRTSGLVSDRAATMEFLEAQLQYDRRRMDGLETQSAAIREALTMYAAPERMTGGAMTTSTPGSPGGTAVTEPRDRTTTGTEALMPQISDSFIDRLLQITRGSVDNPYRQKLIDEYRQVSRQLVPAQQAVAYDEEMLEATRSGGASGTASPDAVRAEIEAIRNDARAIIEEVNSIQKTISRSRNPMTELVTTIEPPRTRDLRTSDAQRLVLMGVLVLLLALPIIIVAVLVHHRFVVEDAVEERGR